MNTHQLLQEIRKLEPAERETVAVAMTGMQLEDITVEVTRPFLQMSPAELLALLDALAPLLSQDLAQLELIPTKSEKDSHLVALIKASLQDYEAFKAETSLLPQKYLNQCRLLDLFRNVELNQKYVFFDTALMLLNSGLASLSKANSKIDLDRMMAVSTCLAVDEYFNDPEVKAFVSFTATF